MKATSKECFPAAFAIPLATFRADSPWRRTTRDDAHFCSIDFSEPFGDDQKLMFVGSPRSGHMPVILQACRLTKSIRRAPELLQCIYQLAQATSKPVVAAHDNGAHKPFPARYQETVQSRAVLFGSADACALLR